MHVSYHAFKDDDGVELEHHSTTRGNQMAMSKKDYVAIAKAVSRTVADDPDHRAKRVCLEALANRLAFDMALDNPRFDRERFLTACGVL
jgi:hypothetical protein